MKENTYKLFLDDNVERRWPPSKVVWVPGMVYDDNDNWILCQNYDEFVSCILKNGLPEFISFDHDLSYEHEKEGARVNFTKFFDYSRVEEKTGLHCAKWLVDYCIDNKLKLPEYVIHSMNTGGVVNISTYLKNAKLNAKL